MNKVTAWVGVCPICSWETYQPSQVATRESVRLHMSAVHREKLDEE